MNNLLLISVIAFLIMLMLFDQDIMAPSFLFCVPLCLSIIVCIIYENRWDFECSVTTYLILILGMLVFAFGDFGSKKIARPNKSANYCVNVRLKVDPIILNIINVISLISVFWVIYEVRKAVIDAGLQYSLFSTSYKTSVTIGNTTYTVSSKSTTVSIISEIISAFAICNIIALVNDHYFEYKNRIGYRIKLMIAPIIYCIIILVQGARGDIVNFAISIIFILFTISYKKSGNKKREKRKLLKITIISAIVLIIFIYSAKFLFQKVGQSDIGLIDYISGYFAAEIDLLNRFINANMTVKYPYPGYETFYDFYAFLYKIKLIDKLPKPSFPYRFYNGFGCNVYTFFKRPYNDFGFVTTLIISFLCGLVSGIIYHKAVHVRNGNEGYMLKLTLYAYFVSKLVLAFFDDYLTTLLCTNTIIKIVILIIIYKFEFHTSVKKNSNVFIYKRKLNS